jgi:Tfp pilus assembly protein PilW
VTTSTRAGDRAGRPRTAFTLVELLVSITCATILIAACLAGITYIFKEQYSLLNYCKMDQQTRKALEMIGRDIRQFDTTDTTNPLTFSGSSGNDQGFFSSIPDPANAANNIRVTYAYSKNNGTFSRTLGNGTPEILITNIIARRSDGLPGFVISGSAKVGTDGTATSYANVEALAAATSSIKQIQIQVTTQSTTLLSRSAGVSSQQITSAQYSIRRKT